MNRRRFLASLTTAAATQLLRGEVFADGLQAVASPSAPLSEKPTSSRDSDLAFSLVDIPFSTAGSFLTINPSTEETPALLHIQTVRRSAISYRWQTGAWSNDLFAIELVRNGVALPYQCKAYADRLLLDAESADASIRFLRPDAVAFECSGSEIRVRALRRFAWKFKSPDGTASAFDSASGYTCRWSAESHTSLVDLISSEGPSGADSFLLTSTAPSANRQQRALLTFGLEQEPQAHPPAAAPVSLAEWMQHTPRDNDPRTQAATRIAWYLHWNLQVSPGGGYRRPTILSSKRSLSAIWSWDNLFTALAVARAFPPLAWDQLEVVLDHQLASGVLPDVVSDTGPMYGFRKPPLWGWAVERLLRFMPVADGTVRLRTILPKLSAFHRWWFRDRDLLGDGVPAYVSGNDSGWDNASVFAAGWPVQSPDLLALLCLDAAHLSALALRAGDAQQARQWSREADRLSALFDRHFVEDDQLMVHVLAPGGVRRVTSTSLLTRLPLLLGDRLRPSVRRRMLAELADPAQFFAPCGPASEALNSPTYTPNGYWRGPVWGPSTLLVCEALGRCGAPQTARDLADRYRRTVARRADFRENYDAISGAGQYDSGMTWCGASFLLLQPFVQPDGALRT